MDLIKSILVMVVIAILVLAVLPTFSALNESTAANFLRGRDYIVLAAGERAPSAGRTATLTLCASNASTRSLAQCDYRVAGTAEDEIQAVLALFPAAGGKLGLSEGNYAIDSSIVISDTQDNITIFGMGMGNTVLEGQSGIAGLPVLYINGTVGDYVENLVLQDFQIDGSSMTPGNIGHKGVGGQYIRNLTVTSVLVKDTPATGFGVDELDGAVFTGDIADNTGTDGGSPGHNGFGIGTGAQSNEPVVLQGCIAFDSGNNGFLFEDQNLVTAGGYITVVGSFSYGNTQHGLRSTGSQRILVSASHFYENTLDGMLFVQGTGQAIEDISIVNTIIADNGDDGVSIIQNTPTADRFRIDSSTITGNGGYGVNALDTSYLSITDSDISANDLTGILYKVNGGVVKSVFTLANSHIYNNGLTGVGSNNDGVNIRGEGAEFSRVTVANNQIFDDLGAAKQRYGLILSGAVGLDEVIVDSNHFYGNTAGALLQSNSTNVQIRNNRGYITESSGTGSVTSGGVTDVIAHGLAVTPTVADCRIIGAEDPTNDVGTVWLDTFGAANFTVNVEADPGASNWDFGWVCEVY